MTTCPFCNSRPGRLCSLRESKLMTPALLPSPVPDTDAVMITGLPGFSNCAVIRIDGINTVVFRRDIHHIVDYARDVDVGQIKRLGIYIPIDGHGEELAKVCAIHIGLCENRLLRVLTGATAIAMLSRHINLDLSMQVGERKTQESNRQHDDAASNARPIPHERSNAIEIFVAYVADF